MYTSNFRPNTRIDVVDVLRGIAIAGILLVHSIEKYNLYYFPETDCGLLKFLDVAAFQGFFQFVLAGKMYAIFALLFGISFFVQNDNQGRKARISAAVLPGAWSFFWVSACSIRYSTTEIFWPCMPSAACSSFPCEN